MRIRTTLIIAGALTLGSCASTSDVRSTESSSNDAGTELPSVDEFDAAPAETRTTTTTANTAPSTTEAPTPAPGTSPGDDDTLVLVASDLPEWSVIRPMTVPEEPTWEAIDCPEMSAAWATTGRPGTRSRGSIDGAAFRNTAVEFDTADDASDVIDAVDLVWSRCVGFEDTFGSTFWSEPIEMPPSLHRTSGLLIGSESLAGWVLAYWQIDATLIVLELEGEEIWTHLDPLMATLSARLDRIPSTSPTSSPSATDADREPGDIPTLVPATIAPVVPATPSTTPPTTPETPTTISTDTAVPSTTVEPTTAFPPVGDEWAEHPLARLAPLPADFGSGWIYDNGERNTASPGDPDDGVEGCDTPIPPTLDGYEVQYQDRDAANFVAILVGDGPVTDSQVWFDAFRALAECDLDPSSQSGSYDVVADWTIDGTDDALLLTGRVGTAPNGGYVQTVGLARVDEILVMAVAIGLAEQSATEATTELVEIALASMLADI